MFLLKIIPNSLPNNLRLQGVSFIGSAFEKKSSRSSSLDCPVWFFFSTPGATAECVQYSGKALGLAASSLYAVSRAGMNSSRVTLFWEISQTFFLLRYARYFFGTKFKKNKKSFHRGQLPSVVISLCL